MAPKGGSKPKGKAPDGEERAMPSLLPPVAQSLAEEARKLLRPSDRQPYWVGGQPIGNLEELVGNLEKFGDDHAYWVADWIEYLGDRNTADRIRAEQKKFKEIVKQRYQELREFLGRA
ncbi:MAG: hypothetical protein QXO51_02480 [Halobacteria archaeon]